VTLTLSENIGKKTAILTVDVEDNFTREELVRPDDWGKYEEQVVENTSLVIASLKELGVGATFFILGRVAERRPEVVSAIQEAGYEVASHGYAHEIVWKMTKGAFEEDVMKALNGLKPIVQKKVQGFRARSFSITKKTPWALNILKMHGFSYDASMKDFEATDAAHDGEILEFPISTTNVLSRNVSLSGGIALRLLPFSLYVKLLRRSPSFQQLPLIYFHVWEYNKDQPKRKVGFLQSLSQSPRTYTTPQRIKWLSRYYSFVSIETYLKMSKQGSPCVLPT
jgi:polysaccharide deacetylase family protein (PEP-CTERM system associated)